LRTQTRMQIAQLQRRLGTTTVYVTHDQVEAMTMGDRVAVLKDGVLQQCASPRDLYRNPANLFVAGFMGSPAMNLFTRPMTSGGVTIGGHMVPLPRTVRDSVKDQVVVGIRPEHLEVSPTTEGISVEVDVVEELGADAYIYGRIVEHAEVTAVETIAARSHWRNPPAKGDTLRLRADIEHIYFYDPSDGRRVI
jgi:multiple sugar transport system ATP-binding protein